MYQKVMQYIQDMSSADVTCGILPTVGQIKKERSTSLAEVCSRILCKDGIEHVSSIQEDDVIHKITSRCSARSLTFLHFYWSSQR